tara:strand:+ start:35161 stop:35871 length:711 start_codon:yes stop_codon:yes gene_type:complete
MTNLSVNINKIATIRNSRGKNIPNVINSALDCQRFGADGITVHPRPDERHITRKDVYDLSKVLTKEFNIEGYPSDDFIQLILDVLPDQVTLVPDPPEVITSCSGWDTIKYKDFLTETIKVFKDKGIRTSIFVNPDTEIIKSAKFCGADRIELYTEYYSENYFSNKRKAILPYIKSAQIASNLDLGINAGHDLNLSNLEFFASNIINLQEVSIGHALISDAIYLGLENTIQMYKRLL